MLTLSISKLISQRMFNFVLSDILTFIYLYIRYIYTDITIILLIIDKK